MAVNDLNTSVIYFNVFFLLINMLNGFYKFTNLTYSTSGQSFNCIKEELQRSLLFITWQRALKTHPEALNISHPIFTSFRKSWWNGRVALGCVSRRQWRVQCLWKTMLMFWSCCDWNGLNFRIVCVWPQPLGVRCGVCSWWRVHSFRVLAQSTPKKHT